MDERIFHLYRRVKELSDFLGGIHIGFFDPRRKIHFQWNEKVQEGGEHIWTRWRSNFGDCSAYSCFSRSLEHVSCSTSGWWTFIYDPCTTITTTLSSLSIRPIHKGLINCPLILFFEKKTTRSLLIPNNFPKFQTPSIHEWWNEDQLVLHNAANRYFTVLARWRVTPSRQRGIILSELWNSYYNS